MGVYVCVVGMCVCEVCVCVCVSQLFILPFWPGKISI